MTFAKEKWTALCKDPLPALLTAFLLSLVWTRSWSLISSAFYATMAIGILTLDWKYLPSLKRHMPVHLFFGWFALSTFWSPSPSAGDLFDFARYAVCMLALLLFLSTPAREKIPWHWLAVAAALPVLLTIAVFYAENPLPVRLRHLGGKYAVTSAALYAFFALIGLWSALSAREKRLRWLNAYATAVLCTAILLTQSRGAVLGFLCGCAAIGGMSLIRRLRDRIYPAALLVLILLTFAPQSSAERPPRPEHETVADATSSFFTRGTTLRTTIWASAIDQMPGHWLIGHGLNAPYDWLQNDYMRYGLPESMPHVHSLIFWALFHGGIVGLALTLALAVHAFREAFLLALESGDTLPLSLLAFGLFFCVFDGSRYIYRPRNEWLTFWIPICLAITRPERDRLPRRAVQGCHGHR